MSERLLQLSLSLSRIDELKKQLTNNPISRSSKVISFSLSWVIPGRQCESSFACCVKRGNAEKILKERFNDDQLPFVSLSLSLSLSRLFFPVLLCWKINREIFWQAIFSPSLFMHVGSQRLSALERERERERAFYEKKSISGLPTFCCFPAAVGK